jgi:hypothetical protein
LQKINLQGLLAHLPLQLRDSPLRPASLSITGKRVARTLLELPSPTVQHIRIHLQRPRLFGNRNSLFQPTYRSLFELFGELPTRQPHHKSLFDENCVLTACLKNGTSPRSIYGAIV